MVVNDEKEVDQCGRSEKITMEHNEIAFMIHPNQFGSKEWSEI